MGSVFEPAELTVAVGEIVATRLGATSDDVVGSDGAGLRTFDEYDDCRPSLPDE